MGVIGIEASVSRDNALRELLLQRLDGAYRLATCILRDRTAAEDAVQEAAARAWAGRHDLRDVDRVEAWFMRIVVNVARAELARQARGRPRWAAGPHLGAVTEGPGETAELRDEVGRALARLTPDEQSLLALRYGRDLTVPQIAAQVGLREGTVKSRLHSAEAHMRAALEAEERAQETRR